MANEYATTAQLRERAGIEVTDLSQDTVLLRALTVASRAIDALCGQRFWQDPAVVTRQFRATSPYELILPAGAGVSTLTGLVVAIDRDDDGVAEDTWAASDYYGVPFNNIGPTGETGWPFNAILTYYKDFPLSTRRPPVHVTAKFGWAAIPDVIVEATLILASEVFKLKDAPLGVVGYGEYGVTRVRENPKVKEMIWPYRRAGGLVGIG